MPRLSKHAMIFVACSAIFSPAHACDLKTVTAAPRQALEDCASQAEKGDKQAEYNLGAAYFGLEEYEQAFHWLKKSADDGHVWGQYQVATLYDRGLGTERDIEMAKTYYSLAARNGDADAMQNLGNIFLENAHETGSADEYETAKKWFQRAACLGQIKSQHNLSLMLAKGEGIAPDYLTAYYWANQAYKNGDKDMRLTITNLEKLMPADDLLQAKKNLQQSDRAYCDRPFE